MFFLSIKSLMGIIYFIVFLLCILLKKNQIILNDDQRITNIAYPYIHYTYVFNYTRTIINFNLPLLSSKNNEYIFVLVFV